ncbi:acyl-CoA dehydrogenase family protein [Candidatus Entotheonella palauensis]|nr:acyl-CoA dehydrogenase family protein [Candidatus Entotheonella palauensis]
MDFRFTAEQEDFRQEIRTFLDEALPETPDMPDDAWIVGFDKAFSQKVGAKGWIGLTWPKEAGGQGRSYLDRLILTEEFLRCGAPVAAHWLGDRQMGPSILHYGTPEQKEKYLPGIMAGESVFCIGMSEPGAGSDLAGLQTKAEEDGDEFVISGQKIWTSFAHVADYCYLVARSNSDVPKHKGISEFIVDMKTPGITVKPIVDITGAHHFNEVFFDQVRIPKSALIGERDRGWYQIAAQLDYERSGIERLMSNYLVLEAISDYAKETGLNRRESIRQNLAQRYIEFNMGKFLVYKVAWLLSQNIIPNAESAAAKAFCTEYEQRLAQTATELLGMHSLLMPGSRQAKLQGRIARAYLYAPAYTIQGGTSTILRTIMAQRGLGLPPG